VLERKVHFSLYQRGRVRVGVNDISELSYPPPAPSAGRGVFVKKFIDGYFNLPAKRQPHRLNGAIK